MKKEKKLSETLEENTVEAADNETPITEASVPSVETGVSKVGTLLKEMRLRKGYKIADVSKKLCIRRYYLEAIEDSNYKEIPGFPYGIGFIRSYADFLGLNSSNIIELYKEETNAKNDKDIYVLEPQTEATVPSRKYLVGSLAAIIAIYAVWYAYNTQNAQVLDDEMKVSDSSVAEIQPDDENLPLVVEDFSASVSVNATVSGEQVSDTTTAEEESVNAGRQIVVTEEAFNEEETSAPQVVSDEVQPIEKKGAPEKTVGSETNTPKKGPIKIQVKKETWIEVKDDQKLYISKVLMPGASYVVPEGKGMILSVGKVDGVDVLVNGTITEVVTNNKKMNIKLDKFLEAGNH